MNKLIHILKYWSPIYGIIHAHKFPHKFNDKKDFFWSIYQGVLSCLLLTFIVFLPLIIIYFLM